ncbi:hypothetical protein BDM02DRAFT_3116490 [Thelephora ganbajun]|uniref:Uncharacterized protein n=1 Tax=Thelephora ganbajun TaxID=370292 RepID=A0ACB6ZDX9_THEGA|nr:hypothetical protein BDM02DRAFT_3116490 [Thelephora ganbajun]
MNAHRLSGTRTASSGTKLVLRLRIPLVYPRTGSRNQPVQGSTFTATIKPESGNISRRLTSPHGDARPSLLSSWIFGLILYYFQQSEEMIRPRAVW